MAVPHPGVACPHTPGGNALCLGVIAWLRDELHGRESILTRGIASQPDLTPSIQLMPEGMQECGTYVEPSIAEQ